MPRVLLLVALSAVAALAGQGTPPPRGGPAPPPVYKSPLGVAVDRDGRRAYVALHTAGSLAVVDLRLGTVICEVPVGRGPHDVALAGGKVFVTCADEDCVLVLDAQTLRVQKIPATAQAPQGLAAFDDDPTLYVACHDAQCLQGIDVRTGRTDSVPLPGWPSRVVPVQNGESQYLLALSTQPGEAVITLLHTPEGLEAVRTKTIPGVSNPRSLASTQEGPWFGVVAAQNPKTHIPTTQIAQGWVFTNGLHLFPPVGGYGNGPVSAAFDSPQRAYSDPSDVALSPDGRHIFVASAGGDCVLVLRKDRVAPAGYGERESSRFLPPDREDLSLSRQFVVATIPTGANPRRLAASGDGKTLVVANHLDDALTVIDAATFELVRTIPLGRAPLTAARRGERLFHSNRMSQFGQFTCASCHPGGGSDGLSWDLTRDGIANFMNTRSLLGVADTPGYGWHGTSPTLRDRVRGTLRNLHNHEPTAGELDDLVAYLETLRPPRPLPIATGDGAVTRGRALFTGTARCSACHAGETLQDGLTHDIGTRRDVDVSAEFDTPSLRGVARTAPYLHDGRAEILEAVFREYNGEQKHGRAHLLGREEMADLLAYLRSL